MCKHDNKILVDWSYNGSFMGGIHDSTYECLDCGETLREIDPPIIYDYNSNSVELNGVSMKQEDYDRIKEKIDIIESRRD